MTLKPTFHVIDKLCIIPKNWVDIHSFHMHWFVITLVARELNINNGYIDGEQFYISYLDIHI